ncbi:MAG TPA: HRDC domain-containing protein [Deinococcales bacterium]|nr:HRDC domain-containing protein [Deinococcales bacterium]
MRDRQLGGILIAIGALLLLSSMRGLDLGWIWVAGLGAVFLIAYTRNRQPGLAVPAGILLGLGAGIMLDDLLNVGGAAILLGMAGGFLLVDVLEPFRHRWALWPAMVLGAIGAMVLIESQASLVAAILVVLGIFVLGGGRLRGGNPVPVPAGQPVAPPPVPAVPLNDESAVRYDRLLAWRTARAAADNVAPAAVITDEQARGLSNVAPRNLDDLRRSLDDRQVLAYGDAILRVMAD